MKSFSLRTAVVVAALFSVPVLAQDAAVPQMDAPDSAQAQPVKPRPGGRFDKTDRDDDGFISKSEFMKEAEERAAERFAKLDTNSDGKIAPEEMRAGARKMGERMKEMQERKKEMMEGVGRQEEPKTPEERQKRREIMEHMRQGGSEPMPKGIPEAEDSAE
ncbi:MAG: hypothetical protein L6Q57_00200 [Alphaproteobacteria bacterium]|nr:hypothetical protein [Alphaproteobacteria bacterium]